MKTIRTNEITKCTPVTAEFLTDRPLNVVLSIIDKNNGDYHIEPEECKKLISLLANPDYTIKEIGIAHPSAITSNKNLLHALNRNYTLTTISEVRPVNWHAHPSNEFPEGNKLLKLILARNYFLSHPENNKHLAICMPLAYSTNAETFQALMQHEFPEDFKEKYQTILPVSLQKITNKESEANDTIAEVFSCFMQSTYESTLGYITDIYTQEEYYKSENDLLTAEKKSLLEVALSSKNIAVINFALVVYEAHSTSFPTAFIKLSFVENFMQFYNDYLKQYHHDNDELIVKVLFLLLRNQPSLIFYEERRLSLTIYSLLISITPQKYLNDTIIITNNLIDELTKDQTLTSKNNLAAFTEVLCTLAIIVSDSSSALQNDENNPWQETMEKLSGTLTSIDMSEELAYFTASNLLGIDREKPKRHLVSFFLVEFMEKTPHKASLFFSKNDKSGNIIQLFYKQMSTSCKKYFSLLSSAFNQIILTAITNNPEKFLKFLEGDISLLKFTSESTQPQLINLTLSLYALLSPLGASPHYPRTRDSLRLLADILNNTAFSLKEKRTIVGIPLQENHNYPEDILFDTSIAQHSKSKANQSLFSLLLQLHVNCITDFIDFLKGLPIYPAISKKLWATSEPMDFACLLNDEIKGELILATIATYNACINDYTHMPTFALLKNKINYRAIMQALTSATKVKSNTKLSLLAFVLDRQPLAVTQNFLIRESGSDFEGILAVVIKIRDDNNAIINFLNYAILEYKHDEQFDKFWEDYCIVSRKILIRELNASSGTSKAQDTPPQSLKLLPDCTWAEIFFNVSGRQINTKKILAGQLQTLTRNTKLQDQLFKTSQPYLLLALAIYFKSHENPFTYANRAGAFLNRIEALLGSTEKALSSTTFLESDFSRLYEQLPKDIIEDSRIKEYLTPLYEFCLSHNNNSDKACDTKFQKYIIKPVLEKISPLFVARVTISNSTHTFINTEQTESLHVSSRVYKGGGHPYGTFEMVENPISEKDNPKLNHQKMG